MSYLIAFDVNATTAWGAIEAATRMLRADVRLNSVNSYNETAPGLWHVVLHVWEDR